MICYSLHVVCYSLLLHVLMQASTGLDSLSLGAAAHLMRGMVVLGFRPSDDWLDSLCSGAWCRTGRRCCGCRVESWVQTAYTVGGLARAG